MTTMLKIKVNDLDSRAKDTEGVWINSKPTYTNMHNIN